jgi:hypothetical protein
MERLRDRLLSPDRKEAFAARLLDTTEPRAASAELRMRIRAHVARQRRARPAMMLRPMAAAMVVVLVLFGTASAMWGRAAIERVAAWTHERAGHRSKAAPLVAPMTDAPLDAIAPPPPIIDPPAPIAPPKSAPHAHAKRAVAIVAASQPVGEAFRLLRQERNPAAAAKLLDDYLAAHPHDELVEEALALRLEAAISLHADADYYAEKYLAQFPTGRFAVVAKNALGD